MSDPYEIAARRFEHISFLIDPSLDDAQRRAAWRERTAQFGRSTIYRWLAAYRESGYLGLLPKQRSDRGSSHRAGTAAWVGYAIGLLYEQPSRSLLQLDTYLRAEFADYSIGRSTLRRHLSRHPAFAGITKLRAGKKSKLRDLYEAKHPHQGWQLDGKGPFSVRFVDGTSAQVTVLSVLDDHSRAILGAVATIGSEATEPAVALICKVAAKWGLAERFQFDRGSAFDSHAFRNGLAALGVHRNYVVACSPQWQGKIEAYHRSLGRWFVRELRTQEIVDLEHLQQLLEATLDVVYNRHHHREIGTTPEKKLAGRTSARSVSATDLERAFLIEIEVSSDPKTGEVRLPNGSFRVPSVAHAGHRSRFRYHPSRDGRAVLVTKDGQEIELRPFKRKTLDDVPIRIDKRGTGQLQKLVDLWRGNPRPNAQPGFGLPEVFTALGRVLGRDVPNSEREAGAVLAFYRTYGPLPRAGFEAACAKTSKSLGPGRPLTNYLADLERQIRADGGTHPPADIEEQP